MVAAECGDGRSRSGLITATKRGTCTIARLRQMQDGIRQLKTLGEQMIPDSLK